MPLTADGGDQAWEGDLEEMSAQFHWKEVTEGTPGWRAGKDADFADQAVLGWGGVQGGGTQLCGEQTALTQRFSGSFCCPTFVVPRLASVFFILE